MITYKQWEESNLNFDEFTKREPSEVDEELYLHFMECTSPSFSHPLAEQPGEATSKVDGLYTFDTFKEVNGKYFYLGVLPQFKGNNY